MIVYRSILEVLQPLKYNSRYICGLPKLTLRGINKDVEVTGKRSSQGETKNAQASSIARGR